MPSPEDFGWKWEKGEKARIPVITTILPATGAIIHFVKCKYAKKHSFMSRGPFLEAPGNYRAREAVLFFIQEGSFKRFENYTVKLSAKETKWTSLRGRTHPTFLENLISKDDFGPVKLLGLSRNGPQGRVVRKPLNVNPGLNVN